MWQNHFKHPSLQSACGEVKCEKLQPQIAWNLRELRESNYYSYSPW